MQLSSIFAFLAGSYCIALGVIALCRSTTNRLNLLFAGYSFSNGIWNFGDVILLAENPLRWVFLLKITGVAGCFLSPFVLHFAFEIAKLSDRIWFRRILIFMYSLGVLLAILHQTPFLHTTIVPHVIDPGVNQYWSDGGPLYPLFIGHMLIGMLILAFTMIYAFVHSRGLQKKQISYIFLACGVGSIALFFFFISGDKRDYYWIYYPCQSLVTFIFSYAIFQYDLIPVHLAIKRAVLIIGLYLIALLLVGLIFVISDNISLYTIPPIGWIILVAAIIVSSGVPVVYSAIIQKSYFFKEVDAAQLTHEFKTPLHAIQSAKSIVEDEFKSKNPDRQMITDYLTLIERNAQRLESFVAQIITVLKTDKQGEVTQLKEMDIIPVCHDAIKNFPHADIKLHSPPSLQFKIVEEGLLQILMNVLSNAVKFGGGKPILLNIQDFPHSIKISVQDNGVGILEKNLNSLFLPFNRKKTGESRAPGTGLGLSIAKKWVEIHGGKIWAESEGENKGTTVIFTLPR